MHNDNKNYIYGAKAHIIAWLICVIFGVAGLALLINGIIYRLTKSSASTAGFLFILFGAILLFFALLYLVFPGCSQWYSIDDTGIRYGGVRRIKNFLWSKVTKCSVMGYKIPYLILIQTDNKVWTFDERHDLAYDKFSINLQYTSELYKQIAQYVKIDDPDKLIKNSVD